MSKIIRLKSENIMCLKAVEIQPDGGLVTIGGKNAQGKTSVLRNHCLAKALSDASLGEILRQIQYKAEAKGVDVVTVGRFYPSSKTCSKCGSIKDFLGLGERQYNCDVCGFTSDRDLNAAKNLQHMAASSAVTACRLEGAGLDALRQGETIDWAGISHMSVKEYALRRV